MKIRQKCKIEGCNRLGRKKGFFNGEPIYGTKCSFHHKIKSKNPNTIQFNEKFNLINDKCSLCGWDKAPCDRHRKNPNIGYTIDNVIILCPNCHRIEETLKLKNNKASN
jgi:hypothetical protein